MYIFFFFDPTNVILIIKSIAFLIEVVSHRPM